MKRLFSFLLAAILLCTTVLSVGAVSQPYAKGTADSDYFRIPSMITLKSGRVFVSADVRYGHGTDSPANIDTGVRYSDDYGDSWSEIQLVNHFTDMEDVSVDETPTNTASFIDSACVAGADDTIYLICDACPAYIGSRAAKHNDSGYIDGKIALCDKTTEDKPESGNLDTAHYPYYIGEYTDGFAPVQKFSDNSVYANYYVDKEFNLYTKGDTMTPVMIPQLDCHGKVTTKNTQANVFYVGSPVKIYPTFYTWMRTSKDGGQHWSDPFILNPQINAKGFTGVGPGRGFCLNGRIMFCVYDTNNGNEYASVIYSDDNGQTWHRGEKATQVGAAGKSSESQLVLLPDGTLRMYSRNIANYIGYTDSKDGGQTWGTYRLDKSLKYCSDCMVSFLNYSGQIDGKDVILASCPVTAKRKLGALRIGLVDKQGKVDWAYQYNLTNDFEDITFIYSCLSELPDGRIALLYEHEAAGITYDVFTLDQLMVHEKQPGKLQIRLIQFWQWLLRLFGV